MPHPHSVLIPVANPETVAQFVHLGAHIARKNDSALILLHVEPGASPYAEEEAPASGDVPVLEQARVYAAEYDLPVEAITHAAPTVADGIIRASQRHDVDYLIMGWRGDLPGGKTTIGGKLDQVVKESRCHTIVMQPGASGEGERLLVPVANPHAAPLALAVAVLLRKGHVPEITVLHLSPLELGENEREAFRSTLFAVADDLQRGPQALYAEAAHFELVFEVQEDPARELAACSARYDRMILGTHRGGYAEGPVFEKLQLAIAQSARCPIVFVRPKEKGARFSF